MNPGERRFWKRYRAERARLVRDLNPGIKKPFRVELTPPQIVATARKAARQ